MHTYSFFVIFLGLQLNIWNKYDYLSVRSRCYLDDTSKQTHLAKVDAGEDGRFLPAIGNKMEYLASFKIVCRVAPMPPGSVGPLDTSPGSEF